MADNPQLVVALSARLDQFEKQLKEAGLIAEREVKGIETKLGNIGGGKDILSGVAGGLVGGLISQLPQLLAKAEEGFAKLQDVIVKLFPAAFPQFEQMNTLVKTHGEIVAGLKDSYGEAAKGIREFSRESIAVLEARQSIAVLDLEANLQRLTRTVTDLSVRALPSLAEMEQGISGLGSTTVEVVGKFKPFETAIRALHDGFAAGNPDIRAFREAVAAIARENQSSIQIQLLAKELLALTTDANNAQRALDAIAASMRQVGLDAQNAAAQGTAFRTAMDKLGRVAPTPVSSREAAKIEYDAALLAASGTEERTAAITAYQAALKRVAAEEARRAPAAATSEKDALSKAHDQLLRNLEVRQAELNTMGQTVAQQEEARQLALLTAAAVRAKLDPEVAVTDEMREQARLAGIRKELIIKTQANLQELVNSSKEFGSALADAFKGMVLEGKKLDEVIKNLTNRLASRAIDQLFNMLFAPQAGVGTTTPFLQLFGLANRMAGGPVSGGSPYLVGERGPELFVPGRSGMIVPNSATRGGAGAMTFAPVNNIDARGSTMGEGQFKAILAANNRQLLQAVNQAAPARSRRLAMLGT